MANEMYPDLSNKFPAEIDNMDKWLDPTLDTLQAINLYYNKYNAGDLAGANTVIANNPLLKRMLVNASSLNSLRDAIISVERFYMNDIQKYLIEIVKDRKAFVPTTKYSKYNVVFFEVLSAQEAFMCVDNNTPIGTLPTDINYFYPLTMRGEKGDSGTGLAPRGQWKNATSYVKDDMVAYSNALWAAASENTDQVPNKNSSSWYLLLEFSSELLTYDNTLSKLNATNIQNAIDEVNTKINFAMIALGEIKIVENQNPAYSKVYFIYDTEGKLHMEGVTI